MAPREWADQEDVKLIQQLPLQTVPGVLVLQSKTRCIATILESVTRGTATTSPGETGPTATQVVVLKDRPTTPRDPN